MNIVILTVIMLNAIVLSVLNAECHHSEHHYADWLSYFIIYDFDFGKIKIINYRR
jgi:hypothetical protein